MSRRSNSYFYDRISEQEEKYRRRILWMIDKQKELEHEKLKQQKIEEFERRRRQAKGLSEKSRKTSRSPSTPSEKRSRSDILHPLSESAGEKCSSSGKSGNKRNQEENEADKRMKADLERFKYTISRSLLPKEPAMKSFDVTSDLGKRREGESLKPIFDREEITEVSSKFLEEEDICRVKSVAYAAASHHESKSRSCSENSRNLHPHHEIASQRFHEHPAKEYSRTDKVSRSHRRRRSYSSSSSESEYRRKGTTSKSRKYAKEEHYAEKTESYRHRTSRSPHKNSSDNYYYRRGSRDRRYPDDTYESRRHRREDREHRRSRSLEFYHPRHSRDSSKQRQPFPSCYVEHVPIPVYYGGMPPRPMMIAPILPIHPAQIQRHHFPGSPARLPRMMAPIPMYRPYYPGVHRNF